MPKSVTLPLRVEQHVLGLDVAVHQALAVRRLQRPPDLDRVGDGLGDGQRPVAPDAVLQRLALDVLEHDERVPLVVAGVDDGNDVGVRHLGRGARLAAEPLELDAVLGDRGVHHLDGDRALQHLVEGAIDRRHPAGADLLFEPEAAVEEGADHSFTILRDLCPRG
jgi:hypothetical protein